jgi:hypothetical protein
MDAGGADGGDAADGDAGSDSSAGDATAGDAPADAQAADAAGDATADAAADAPAGLDAGHDAGTDSGSDAGVDATPDGNGDASQGPISGGPCLSGAPGAAASRISFVDAGGEAQVTYEAWGLPDHSREQAGAYGYQIGFVPPFVDPFLAQGGLQLDSSDFIQLDLSTVGISTISAATLSVYGRSYSVDTDGSFSWQTFVDSGSTATDFVSNVPPYRWYSADVLSAIDAGNGGITLRIQAGPSSGALVVNAVELCLSAR